MLINLQNSSTMNKQKIIFFLILGLLISLAACTAGPNTTMDVASPDGHIAGFFLGLWHGIIAPFTFVISLFTDQVSLYEVHNNGGWYDFGFVLGAGILFGGSSRAARKKN
ncbi:hypothetical protein ES705_19632 [subsurface metagenome]